MNDSVMEAEMTDFINKFILDFLHHFPIRSIHLLYIHINNSLRHLDRKELYTYYMYIPTVLLSLATGLYTYTTPSKMPALRREV